HIGGRVALAQVAAVSDNHRAIRRIGRSLVERNIVRSRQRDHVVEYAGRFNVKAADGRGVSIAVVGFNYEAGEPCPNWSAREHKFLERGVTLGQLVGAAQYGREIGVVRGRRDLYVEVLDRGARPQLGRLYLDAIDQLIGVARKLDRD